MKRTDMAFCVAIGFACGVYRMVVTDGERYFIKYNGELIDVTKKIENGEYVPKSWLKES